MPTYIVYKATNKMNGKSYIGFTSRSLDARKRDHISNANKNNQSKFCKALRKYGNDSFDWSILFESNDLYATKNIMEPRFILEYNSKLNGYNMTDGGDGVIGYTYSDEIKEWFKHFHRNRKRKPHSEHTKAVISKNRTGISAWNCGLKGSDYPFRNPKCSCVKCKKVFSNNVINRHHC